MLWELVDFGASETGAVGFGGLAAGLELLGDEPEIGRPDRRRITTRATVNAAVAAPAREGKDQRER